MFCAITKTVDFVPDPNDIGGIQNENYDDSLTSSDSNSGAERSDSGLDHSADELDRRQNFSLDDELDEDDDLQEDDEGVFHEDPLVRIFKSVFQILKDQMTDGLQIHVGRFIGDLFSKTLHGSSWYKIPLWVFYN